MTIIHKSNYKEKFYVYLGFGHYMFQPTALCDNSLRNHQYHRNWESVTCKKCLKLKVMQDDNKPLKPKNNEGHNRK